MSLLTVETRSTAALAYMRNAEKRTRYAIANALNATAKAAQRVQRQRVEQRFTVRRRDFIRREAAIIRPFANARTNQLWVRIVVGMKSKLLLSQYEKGGERRPFSAGSKNVAVPDVGGARPTQGAEISPNLLVRSLALRRRRCTGKRAAGPGAIRGLMGTYLVPEAGIYQRRPGERRARLLYAFAPSVPIDRRLGFVETVRSTAVVIFPRELEREVSATVTRNLGFGGR